MPHFWNYDHPILALQRPSSHYISHQFKIQLKRCSFLGPSVTVKTPDLSQMTPCMAFIYTSCCYRCFGPTITSSLTRLCVLQSWRKVLTFFSVHSVRNPANDAYHTNVCRYNLMQELRLRKVKLEEQAFWIFEWEKGAILTSGGRPPTPSHRNYRFSCRGQNSWMWGFVRFFFYFISNLHLLPSPALMNSTEMGTVTNCWLSLGLLLHLLSSSTGLRGSSQDGDDGLYLSLWAVTGSLTHSEHIKSWRVPDVSHIKEKSNPQWITRKNCWIQGELSHKLSVMLGEVINFGFLHSSFCPAVTEAQIQSTLLN